MDKAFRSIEGDTNAGTPGHRMRIAVGNMIKNTTDDREYLHELFSNVSDYDPEITDRQYDSLDHQPITCAKLQEYGICSAPCQLMKDIGKKSPIAFAYRKRETQQKLTRELLGGISENENFKELLVRARYMNDPIQQLELVKQIAGNRGEPINRIESMLKRIDPAELDDSYRESCRDWWRIGAKFVEAVVLDKKGTVVFSNRGVEDVKERLGKDAGSWIIRNKSLHDSVVLNRVGGGLRSLGYEY